jgi:transcription elongation factor GreA
MALDRIPMSKDGYERKRADLDHLKNEERPRLADAVAHARSYGDLSENAEYDAAREAQGMLEAKISLLESELAMSMIVDTSNITTDSVKFGTKVKVLDVDLDEEEEFTLVGPGDEDYDKNRILTTSPIGEGLIGKKVGQEVHIAVPRGTLTFKVLEINLADE